MRGFFNSRRAIILSLVAVSVLALGLWIKLQPNLHALGNQSYYVSPTGSDSNPGTQDQPFLTVNKARDVIRANKSAGNTVYLRGGIYPSTTRIDFTAADSGKDGAPNVYKAYAGEKPILRGSVEISQFTPYQGNLVVADLAAQGLSTLSVPNLYMNSDSLDKARSPNYKAPNFSALDPYAGDFFSTTSATTANRRTFYYDKGQINAFNFTPTTNTEVVIYSSLNYVSDVRHIASFDPSAGTITLDQDTSYDITAGNHFYIRNVLRQLDSPGEWYYEAASKKLYLYPPHTLTSSDRISVPVSGKIISTNNAKYLDFRGLTFEETTSHALYIYNSSNITVADSEVRNAGGDGIRSEGITDNLTLEKNIIHDIGYNGILSYSDISFFKQLNSAHMAISNNEIYRIGKDYDNAYGMNISSVGALVSHNEVHDLPRVGIAFKGNDNSVEFNTVYNVNQITQDSGGITMPGRTWLYRGNIIHDNFVHDTGGYELTSAGWRFTRSTWGIYLDDFTSGTKVYNNVVARTGVGAFQVHGGRDNDIYNNVAVGGANTAQVWFQGWNLADTGADESMLTELNNMQSNGYDRAKYFAEYPDLNSINGSLTTATMFANNKFHQNIEYFPDYPTTDSLLVEYFVDAPGNSSNDNVFWTNFSAHVFQVQDLQASDHGGSNNRYSWDLWKSLGFDTRSVQADPKFTDATKDSYALSSNSPALALGITSIDQSKMGIVKPSDVIKDDSSNATSSSNTNTISNKTSKVTLQKQIDGSIILPSPTDLASDLVIHDNVKVENQAWYARLWRGICRGWNATIGFFHKIIWGVGKYIKSLFAKLK